MPDTLYTGFQGLDRSPTQEVLYEWNKNQQLASLPHGAYIGQCDMRANGDVWAIMRAGEAVRRGRFFKESSVQTYAQNLPRAYGANDYHIAVANDDSTAVLEDQFVGGLVMVTGGSGAPVGASGRIVSNTSAPAASGSNYPPFTLTLEYPLGVAIPVAGDLKIQRHIWNGVQLMNQATDTHAVGWSPIDVTLGYYFWGKIAGTAVCRASSAITVGQAVAATGSTSAGDQGSVHPVANDTQQAVGFPTEAIADDAWGAIVLTLGIS